MCFINNSCCFINNSRFLKITHAFSSDELSEACINPPSTEIIYQVPTAPTVPAKSTSDQIYANVDPNLGLNTSVPRESLFRFPAIAEVEHEDIFENSSRTFLFETPFLS